MDPHREGFAANRHIHSSRPNPFQQQRRNFLYDGDARLRKFPGKGGEHRWQKIRPNRGNHSDTHCPGDRRLALDNVAACRFEVNKNSPGARKKSASELRRTNGAAEAIEEPRPQFVFKFANLLRKRRLRDVRLLRRAAEATGVGDGAKIAKLVKFHSWFL